MRGGDCGKRESGRRKGSDCGETDVKWKMRGGRGDCEERDVERGMGERECREREMGGGDCGEWGVRKGLRGRDSGGGWGGGGERLCRKCDGGTTVEKEMWNRR